jgi:glycosyltransferase involved in cell wall biosynthesis
MKVIHLASELTGGAGLAALRLHTSLKEKGVDTELLYGYGFSPVAATRRFIPRASAVVKYLDRILDQLVWRSLRPGAALFTRTRRLARAGGLREALAGADIVHLHWVAKWLDLPALFSAIPLSARVVMTLHDTSFLAGGCHQTDECIAFHNHCGHCPKLRFAGRWDLSASGFRQRKSAYQSRTILAVPTSQWMANHTRPAALLKNARVAEPIYPGINTFAFRPLPRQICRDLLGIPADLFVVCAGSADLGNTGKGMGLLLAALATLPESLRDRTALLTYGSGVVPGEVSGIRTYHTGYLTSERLLSTVYSAADVFCTPSQMETFGMTAAEAAACGLPVIAFATGGLAEIVQSGVNGWLVPLASVEGLSHALRVAALDPAVRTRCGAEGRRRAERLFDIRLTASRYQTLYESLK